MTLKEVRCRRADLDVTVEGAGALGAVGDPVGLLVDGGQAGRGGRCVLGVALHAGQQDAAQGGLGRRVQQQRGGEAWRDTTDR